MSCVLGKLCEDQFPPLHYVLYGPVVTQQPRRVRIFMTKSFCGAYKLEKLSKWAPHLRLLQQFLIHPHLSAQKSWKSAFGVVKGGVIPA